MTGVDLQLEEAAIACQALINNQQTLMLSSYSIEQGAEISYAPYVRDENGRFFIYTSNLASHTGNLLTQEQASILFLGLEADSRNLFARERATFNCQVKEVRRDDAIYDSILDQLQEQFGQVVAVLRSLPDFHLLVLTPRSGRYVIGFGKAFDIDPATRQLQHVSS